ncbi:MAG TPA: glycoside hydrolase family 97 catalytic domain-containing protein, partial [Pirellulales bacterium]
VSASPSEPVKDDYEILTTKRRQNHYRANRRVFHLETAAGKKLDVIFQVSNDGVAFRYFFPDDGKPVDIPVLYKLKEETTTFHFLPGTKAWLQPMQVAKTGFEKSNPAYEEYYAKQIDVGTPSKLGAGWVYPALFHSGDTWLLISEAALGKHYCGTRLRHESPDGEYSIGFPDPREIRDNGPANPESSLPWYSPWRIIVVGPLKAIAESTLGVDLADKPAIAFDASGKPGKASWSWPLLGDSQTKFDTQKRFIDYAADMGWSYCLIDCKWDKQIGYDRAKELADYAATKNIGVLLWYNSAGDWNTVNFTPRDKMLTHESRTAEFEKLKQMGIKGVKIDFFGGDGQSMIDYYAEILEDAAPYGLLVNFHGATLPRGLERTYPNLMTIEAIRGFEYVTFEQRNADEEPRHATVLPFTRNVFDPMDFTPVCLDRVNNRIKRRTTSAFELALSVLFTSGIQHYAEIPAGMAKMPDYVQDFLRHVPTVWDDVKFIDGYPGKFVVLARQGDNGWYVAGINGDTEEQKLNLDLTSLPNIKRGQLIQDGVDGERFQQSMVELDADKKLDLTIQPHGGFVMVLEPK